MNKKTGKINGLIFPKNSDSRSVVTLTSEIFTFRACNNEKTNFVRKRKISKHINF